MRTKREVICSQQAHCLSCPLSVMRTGRDCEELTLEEIKEIMQEENDMYINGKWYTEPQIEAYVNELEKKVKERECEADNGARQIALYEDENRQLKQIVALARSEVHRPYPEYKYRFEIETDKLFNSETTVYHVEE